MTVLVLGGTGYLGGNIVDRLVRANHAVICTVRPDSDCSRLQLSSGQVTLISSRLEQVEITLRNTKVDWVINGVCTYNQNKSLYGDMLESNVIFPLGVLNCAIKYGVRNFMTMGSSLPSDLNVYSFTKSKFGEFGEFLSHRDPLNFIELKLEMFYGGLFEPDSRFLKSCKNKLQHNETLQLTEGVQKRDLVRVEDVVEIIMKFLERDNSTGFHSYDVGSGEQHSIREIVEFLKDTYKSESKLEFGAIPSRIGEPDTLSDTSWMKELGYTPKFSFWEGLRTY